MTPPTNANPTTPPTALPAMMPVFNDFAAGTADDGSGLAVDLELFVEVPDPEGENELDEVGGELPEIVAVDGVGGVDSGSSEALMESCSFHSPFTVTFRYAQFGILVEKGISTGYRATYTVLQKFS